MASPLSALRATSEANRKPFRWTLPDRATLWPQRAQTETRRMNANDTPPDSLVGTLIDRKYRIERCIGRGGMGAVYEAANVAIGKRVALKFLEVSDGPADRDAVVRFQREAEAASAVESAHIVQIFDSGTTADDRPYLVMELLRGEDLRARMKRVGKLPESDVIHIAMQTLRALVRAHEAGIVHRDLKPDNLFLDSRDDDPLFVKVVDFGISKVTQTRATNNTLTRRGTVLGTAYYMAPEQAQAFPDIDGRADLYSLGAICFEALTGEAPHSGGSYEAILVKACTQDAPDVRRDAPETSEAFAKVIAKALARDRAERYQDAREFLDALIDACPDLVRSGPVVLRSSRPEVASGHTAVVTAGGTAVPTSGSRWPAHLGRCPGGGSRGVCDHGAVDGPQQTRGRGGALAASSRLHAPRGSLPRPIGARSHPAAGSQTPSLCGSFRQRGTAA